MAGIGFILRKLSKQDNLIGIMKAYTHSTMASTGPWLFTVLALGGMMILGSKYTSLDELFNFRITIIYNFAFSLIFSGPIFMIVTRYLSDCIYKRDVSGAPGLLLGALLLLYATQLPLVSAFYLLYATFPTIFALSAIANFMLITTIWLIAIFLSALKDYASVTKSFAIGLFLATISAIMLTSSYGAIGILNGFNIGLSYIVASLIAQVFVEYPYKFREPFKFLSYFKKYWEIALSGLIYNLACWVDKWIMWFAPEAERTSSNLFLYPNYDSAMFLAYLTIVPSMAFFVFSIETSFFETYLKFFGDVQKKANYKKIVSNHKNIISVMIASSRNFLILQSSICISVILLSPHIFETLNINYLQISIFRYGVLGALFHVMIMFLTIMLSYFDNRKAALKIQTLFLITNASFTYISLKMGFSYYGYGYFLSCVVVFIAAAFTVAHYLNKLPFHTFITSNTSV